MSLFCFSFQVLKIVVYLYIGVSIRVRRFSKSYGHVRVKHIGEIFWIPSSLFDVQLPTAAGESEGRGWRNFKRVSASITKCLTDTTGDSFSLIPSISREVTLNNWDMKIPCKHERKDYFGNSHFMKEVLDWLESLLSLFSPCISRLGTVHRSGKKRAYTEHLHTCTTTPVSYTPRMKHWFGHTVNYMYSISYMRKFIFYIKHI